MNKTQLQEKLIKETKYSKWYLDIIENAKTQNRIKLSKLNEDYTYYENHHILPKAKGLFDEYSNLKNHKWNGVLLTAREHFICHMCLAKHYKSIKYTKGEQAMGKAFFRMSNGNKYNSKNYSYFKLDLKGGTSWNKGIKCSAETKQKISDALKGREFTKEHKNNIGKSSKGRIFSEESKKKMSISRKGNKLSDEHKRNISLGKQNISIETKKKLSLSHKGQGLGRKISEETKKKMREAQKMRRINEQRATT